VETDPTCLKCFIRQAVDVSLLLPEGPARESFVAQVKQLADDVDLSRPPVEVAQAIHRRMRELAGDPDPYRAAKRVFDNLVLDLLPELRGMIRQAPDPLLIATRLAIAANIIDFGPNGALTPVDVLRALRGVLREPFHADWQRYVEALSGARRILYLADNAGEIVADQLLIRQIGPGRVTVAVRGGAVINDATMGDARHTGLDRLVRVIDNGSDAPGTLLDDCSPEFRDLFANADMIIAKGQGNFEALSDVDRPLFFLFKVKCPVVARHVGLPEGTHVLLASGRWGGRPTSGGVNDISLK
jgi:uncharacterized protein with ATP-grasp and redox domains